MSSFVKTLIILAIISGILFAGWYFYKEVKRDVIMKKKAEMVSEVVETVKDVIPVGKEGGFPFGK